MFNGFFENAMWQLDQGVTGLFAQWNSYSTAIATILVMFLSYQVFARRDPDTHPLLLARQAQASPVRYKGESSVYRSHSSPHGMPLNSGLNVKDPGASKWSRGRDGDLRDVWRQAISGTSEPGKPTGKGKILTVLGGQKVLEHKFDDVTRQINLIGKHILDQGGARVAIYLPNSVELMAAIFACAFYNLTAVLIPFDQSDEAVISMLRRAAVDTVVALPGSFPFDLVVKNYPSLRHVIWVVDEGNRHMDWNEVPQGMGGSIEVVTWQDIVQDSPADAGTELPPFEGQAEPRDMTIFWPSKPGVTEEMVRFTNANIVSAIAAQLFAIPQTQRLGPSDLFLPAASLASTYTLSLTLAALYSNASVAFNSSAGDVDLGLATRGIAPTVIVASPQTLLKTHELATRNVSSFFTSKIHWLQTRELTQTGVMPAASFLTSYNDSLRPAIGQTPGKLRLVYTAERAGSGTTPPLSSAVLSDLRIYLGARIIYALTAAKVAGAVAQTQFYDYRVHEDKCSHFGPPVTSVEILLRDSGDHKTTDEKAEGELIARGPSVANGEAALGVNATIRFDNTIAYV
ncbi:acetyl-CoA synthetase-like protein [Cryphonectria parasitica EP155]|uniref:Acetyl-CoA synthetase-like protein n=1 Tax=Cryphonectria parasitica (strain ATCC 38755 / EP155) TaxID=660469 RepID=A0A9P4YCX0_CRYP1|nr:acetyl-CoA synthetase-like protein [Cryphonectria parasitica EP155]KAF3770684.1 acetyl-CoA synthetase-like protein [Cryphonectria parasitica EP155]